MLFELLIRNKGLEWRTSNYKIDQEKNGLAYNISASNFSKVLQNKNLVIALFLRP